MGRAFRKAQRFLKISANQLNAGETGIARANQQKLDCKTFYMLTYKTLNILIFFLKKMILAFFMLRTMSMAKLFLR